MKHLDFTPTPVTSLPYYSEKFGCQLLCKRDDLFAEAGGGSKARMLQYILADVNRQNCDVLVTAGGPCSNFNRACALMCAKIGVSMHLVEYTDNPDEFESSLNYFLCKLAGITRTRCKKDNVPDTIKRVLDSYFGKKVKFVYGGGKSIEGIFAYFDAIAELKKQVEVVDHLFVSCGTGTTLTGICAGMQKFFPNAHVHAISVSRSFQVEKQTLDEDMVMLNNYLGSDYGFDNMTFYEDYLCGGYDCTTPELLNQIQECISKEGMIIDPCYSGKSFFGMIDILKKCCDMVRGKTIVYWNTGGLMNLLSMKSSYEI